MSETPELTSQLRTESYTSSSDSAFGTEHCNSPALVANVEPEKEDGGFTAEIDTSSPFKSVKEAAVWFGGFGHWNPYLQLADVENQAAQLQKDVIAKEREILDILIELEATKFAVEKLKSTIDRQTFHDKENLDNSQQNMHGFSGTPSSAPGLILMQLQQAKLNLDRTSGDLSDIRASIESFNNRIVEEKVMIEQTHNLLNSNSSKHSVIVKELNQTRKELQLAKDIGDISMKLQVLSCEKDMFKKMGEEAKSKILKSISEIEQTKMRIKTVEKTLVASQKIKKASRVTETIAYAEIKALSNKDSERITLSFEEYSSLKSKARKAEELFENRVVEARFEVDQANVSYIDIMEYGEEAKEEVSVTKRALEQALIRAEIASRDKLSVECSLRKWRSDHSQSRRAMHNSGKFKNTAYLTRHSKSSVLFDVNELNLVNTKSFSVETEVDKDMDGMKQASPREQSGEEPVLWNDEKVDDQNEKVDAKKKKSGFARFSLLLGKKSKKKKKKKGSIYGSCIAI